MLHVTTLTTTEREELLDGAPWLAYEHYAPGEELPIGDALDDEEITDLVSEHVSREERLAQQDIDRWYDERDARMLAEEAPYAMELADQRRAKGPACWRCGAEERVTGTTLCSDCLPLVLSLHAGESGYAAARAAWAEAGGMTDKRGTPIGVGDPVWVMTRTRDDRPDERLAVVRSIETSSRGTPYAVCEFTPHLPPRRGGYYYWDQVSCTPRELRLRD